MSFSLKRSFVHTPSRRAIMTALAAAPLAACGSSDTSQSEYNLGYSTLSNALGEALGFKDSPSVSREEAAAIPYSSIGYRIGSSGQGLLVLASQTGSTFLWTSASHVVIVTEGGRITKTAGFPWNLAATTFRGPDPATDFSQSLPSAANRTVDFPDLARFEVTVSSTFASAGPETIQILGQPLETLMVVENCACNAMGWRYRNKYWVDRESRFVWKTEQFTHPKLDALQIEVLRPPG